MNFENCLQLKKEFHQLKLGIFATCKNYLDLSIVNPDLQPEKQIIDKLLEFSLQKSAHRYSSAQGLPELRQAVAARYKNKYKVNLNWQEQITIARGTNAAISNIIELFIKKNLRRPAILLPTPTYSMHLEIAKKHAGECYFYNINQSEDQILKEIKEALLDYKIDLLLLNFPNNPTGKLVSQQFYQTLAESIIHPDLWIINDFVYGDITFNQENAISLLSRLEGNNFFEVFSLSKNFSLAGWRLAIIVGNAELIKELIKTQTEIDYGSYQGFQRAAAFALDSEVDYSKGTRDIYKRRAQLMTEELATSEIEIISEPSGCFLWCKLPNYYTLNSFKFCSELLIQQKLAVQPGEIFGINLDRYFRVSLTAEDSQLADAVIRINAVLR